MRAKENPDCQRVSAPDELECGKQGVLSQALTHELNVFPHKDLLVIILPLPSHCLSHEFNPFHTAQLLVQRVNVQGLLVVIGQSTLNLAHWLLQFILVFF